MNELKNIDINSIEKKNSFNYKYINKQKFDNIIEPILVVKNPNNKYIIIDGYNRYFNSKNNKILALIYDNNFDFALFKIKLKNDFNKKEFKYNYFIKIIDILEKEFNLNEKDILNLMKELEINFSKKNFDNIYTFLNKHNLFLEFKNIELNDKSIQLLNLLSNENIKKTLNLLKDIEVNANKFYTILNIIITISRKEKIDINTIIDNLYSIINNDKLNNPQKLNIILKELDKLNKKNINELIAKFEETKKSLKLIKGILLKNNNFFEKDEYIFQVTFNNVEDLQNKIDFLNKIDKNLINKLFNILE